MADKTRKGLHPSIPGVCSGLIMGLGQLINKSWGKALMFFLFPVILVSIELASSNWGRYIKLASGGADEIISKQSIDYDLNGSTEETEVVIQESAGSLADILGLGVGDSDESEDDLWGDEDDLWGSEEDLWGDSVAESEDDLWGSDEEMSEDDLWGSEDDLWASDDDTEESVGYFNYEYEYPNYAYSHDGEKYIIRDFGGFITRGMWGLFTLGKLVIGDEYAGKNIELYNKITGWLSADNSTQLLGNGLIALVVVLVFIFFYVICIVDAVKERSKINSGEEVESTLDYLKRIWRDAYVYVILSPAIVLVLIFTLIPFLFTFLLAFTDYSYKIKLGADLISWTGFAAFKQAVVDPSWLSIFSKIFAWTVFWAVMSSFTCYAVGFINALVVESPLVKGKKAWRTIMILPWAIPSLISLMLFKNVFNREGLMNQILFATRTMEGFSKFLYNIGLQGKFDQPIYWFDPIYNGNLAKAVVVLVNLWLGAPYFMMLIIGVLSTIPKDLYEAANIDGATGLQRFNAITLPMVLAATLPSIIMTFSFNFNNFGAVYFLTGGGPLWDPTKVPESMRVIGGAVPGQTDILISWIYKLSFTQGQEVFNVAAVYSIIIFIIVGGFSVFNLLKSKSFSEEE